MKEKATTKFFNNCKICLLKQSLNDLRVYGRGIGVRQPTIKKKQELIEDIIGVLSGAIVPIEVSKRGAPVKNTSINREFLVEIERIKLTYLNELNEENGASLSMLETPTKDFIIKKPKKESPATLVFEDEAQESDEYFAPIYKGQVVDFNGVMHLLPLDFQTGGETTIIPTRLLKEQDIRVGDVVSCRAKKKDGALIATAILTVNDLVLNSFSRGNFNKDEIVYPTNPLSFIKAGRKNSVFGKYMHWFAPVCKGQRACIVAPPKSGKTTVLLDVLKSVKACNDDVYPMVLLVDQSPETVSKFRTVAPKDSFVYTTYEDDPERQVFAGEFVLERAKRYAECGKNVVLFIDSLNTLASAFNETEASSGGKTLACGLERKTVHYIKKFFGASRAFTSGGSLTIIATLASSTGSPADDVIVGEISGIANAEIALDMQLAMKRCYPALSPTRTHVTNDGNEEFDKLDRSLRQSFLIKYSAEDLLKGLEDSESFEEMYSYLNQR